MKKLVIVGASGHGKVIADIAVKNGYEEIAFLDDNDNLQECGGYPVIGKSHDAVNMKSDIIIGIGNPHVRKQLQESLDSAYIVTLIHPDAVVAADVQIGKGTVIMAGAVINPGTIIGDGCIINTCSSVDHDCQVGNYVHIAVGSHLCGTVTVYEETWIGAGATIINNIVVCHRCMIGAGAVVVDNIEDPGTYIGVPAKKEGLFKVEERASILNKVVKELIE